ncbi:MAG: Crp/Fnr family transcriptional regulator [Persicimonas sp.]
MKSREIRRIHPLQRLRLFRDISREEFDRVHGLCFEMEFDDGEVIVEEGDDNCDLFVLMKGRVDVEKVDDDGDHHKIADLEAETVFGEIGFVLQNPRTATVIADGAAQVLRVDGPRFQQLRADGHAAAYKIACNILEMLAKRQDKTNRHLLELTDRLDDVQTSSVEDDVSNLRNKLRADWSF